MASSALANGSALAAFNDSVATRSRSAPATSLRATRFSTTAPLLSAAMSLRLPTASRVEVQPSGTLTWKAGAPSVGARSTAASAGGAARASAARPPATDRVRAWAAGLSKGVGLLLRPRGERASQAKAAKACQGCAELGSTVAERIEHVRQWRDARREAIVAECSGARLP